MRANLCRRKSTVTLDWKLSRAEHVPVSIPDRSCQTINVSLFRTIQRYELANFSPTKRYKSHNDFITQYIYFPIYKLCPFNRLTLVKWRYKELKQEK